MNLAMMFADWNRYEETNFTSTMRLSKPSTEPVNLDHSKLANQTFMIANLQIQKIKCSNIWPKWLTSSAENDSCDAAIELNGDLQLEIS